MAVSVWKHFVQEFCCSARNNFVFVAHKFQEFYLIESWSDYLQNDFRVRARKNSSFSLRAYAKLLSISPTHLSLILAKKRKVSPASAMKIAFQLGITPSETIERLQFHRKKLPTAKLKKLNYGEFKLISQWYHFAILGLADLKTNVAEAQWIANKLAIPVSVADQAFKNLQKHGYLTVKGGQFRFTQYFETQTDISSEEIRQFHKQALNLASTKIDEIDVELREFISLTIAINHKNIKATKLKLRKFKEEMEKELDVGPKNEVYQLNIQFFPLTTVEKVNK